MRFLPVVLATAAISAVGVPAFAADLTVTIEVPRLSVASYAVAAGLALVHPGIALAIYLSIILLWFVPDRRMERILRD